jgi:hypothetical protein
MTGLIGLVQGDELDQGGVTGEVGPTGPIGCVSLWQPQSFGGLSPSEITAGTGIAALTGAGRAKGEPD